MNKQIAFALVVIATVSGCADKAQPVPTAIAAVTATALPPAVVATAVAPAPTFEARTASGTAVKNVTVAVAVTAGGGSLVSAPVKTIAGPTSIGTWTLGTGTGTQSVTVTSPGLAPIVFTIDATHDVADGMEIVEGNDQRAPENGTIPNPIRVRVFDQHDNAVPGVTVTWAVDAGGGLLPGATTSLTNASGIATAPTWTLGLDGSGEQGLTAAAPGVTGVRFTAEVQEPAANITIETAPPASASAGRALVTAPTFAVRDAASNILNGVPVTISVTAGTGSVTNQPTVSAAGPTSIGTWTLGTALGTQSVTVSVAGVPSAVFTTQSVPGPASLIQQVEGNGQTANPGQPVASTIRVRVTDAFSHPIEAANVNWSVLQGGGLLNTTATVTDALGETVAPTWSVGNCGGPQSLLAISGTGTGITSATMNQSAYALAVHWTGQEPGGAVQAAFDAACQRMRSIITGELTQVSFVNFNANLCVPGLTLNEVIPGLRIYATVEFIDGVGQILGTAGPCYPRNSNSLTVVGRMRFDSADLNNMVNNGSITSVILHEMLHVIGIGTLFDLKGLQTGSAPETTPLFTGLLAKQACVDDHNGAAVCGTAVPLEDCLDLVQSCGGGTRNSHWKESVFRTELMTGFLNAGQNPFSKMTMQALADLGYTVNFSSADSYTVPAASLWSSIPAYSIKMPEPTGPLATVDDQGRIVKQFRPQ